MQMLLTIGFAYMMTQEELQTLGAHSDVNNRH